MVNCMISKRVSGWIAGIWLVSAGMAHGAVTSGTLYATQQNLMAQLALAKPGQTLILQGRFNEFTLRNRDFGGVTVDASSAHFTGGFTLRNVHNITFVGGTYGIDNGPLRRLSTVDVLQSSNISFAEGNHLGWEPGRGRGIFVTDSQAVTVRDNRFSNMRLGIGFTNVRDGLIARNDLADLTSDGINIVSSYRVIASHNQCSGFRPSAGAHPDCIQLWSLAGNAVQSDIMLLNNVALGSTQGFTSFDAARGGGLRITMAGNFVASEFPQGLACYACVDSVFTDNLLISLPHARWRTSINIVGGGNNMISGNQLLDNRTGVLSMPQIGSNWIGWTPALAGRVGSSLDERTFGLRAAPVSQAIATVPENATWLLLMVGFAMVGRSLRSRRGLVPLAAA